MHLNFRAQTMKLFEENRDRSAWPRFDNSFLTMTPKAQAKTKQQ